MTLARLPKIGRCCQLIIKNATGLTKYQMLIKAPGDLKMRLIRFIAATGLNPKLRISLEMTGFSCFKVCESHFCNSAKVGIIPQRYKTGHENCHAVVLASPRCLRKWCKFASVVPYRLAINFCVEPFLSNASISTR
jgi:hypothetical protein